VFEEMTMLAAARQPLKPFDDDVHGRRGLPRGADPTAAEIQLVPAWSTRVLELGAQVVDDLPAFPSTATRILALLEAKDPEPKELMEVIQTDPAVSALLLKLANSAALTRGVEITTVRMATMQLGFRTVASVALAASTKALLDQQARQSLVCLKERFHALSEASLRVALASRWLAKSIHRANPEEAFLAGLMLDLGKVVALRIISSLIEDGEVPASLSKAALERLLHGTHVELGVDLTAVWDLPGYITHVCAHHHAPTPARAPINDVLHVVRIASTLDALRTNPFAHHELPAQLRWSAEALALEPEPLAALADALAELQ
jgi:HD-like signal output (HDOD) protein